MCFPIVCLSIFAAYAVLDRSTDREWHDPSGTSDGRGDPLEQICQGVGNSKTRTLLQQLIIYCSIFRLHWVAREKEKICKGLWTDTKRQIPTHPTELSKRQIQTTDRLTQLLTFSKFANFQMSKYRISVRWCHLVKLLRPNSLFSFTQTCNKIWIYFVYIWVFLCCSLVYSLKLSYLTKISANLTAKRKTRGQTKLDNKITITVTGLKIFHQQIRYVLKWISNSIVSSQFWNSYLLPLEIFEFLFFF